MSVSDLLKTEFALAKDLHISPYHLDRMDYAEVRFLNDELAKFLAGD